MLRRVLGLLLLGSLVLAACGGDDGAAANGGDGDAGQEVDAGEGDGDGGSIGTIDATRCAEVVAAMAAASAGVQAVSAGAGDLEGSIEQLEAFSAAAPEEIRDDMLIIAEGYARVAEALAEAGYDPASGEVPPPEVIAALTAAGEELQTEEFMAASERVNAWFEQECGA